MAVAIANEAAAQAKAKEMQAALQMAETKAAKLAARAETAQQRVGVPM